MSLSSGGGFNTLSNISKRGLRYSWPDGLYVPRVARLLRASMQAATSAMPPRAHSPPTIPPTMIPTGAPSPAAAVINCKKAN